MKLCLDVGNSHIYGGVFEGDTLSFRFRYPSNQVSTSDQIGIFLRSIFRENDLSSDEMTHIAICSVVPSLNYSLRAACLKYFEKEPFFLQAGVKTGLNIHAKNPREVGADRIANAVAVIHRYLKQNVIVVDFGTATTFCAVTAQRDYLGGPILPGMRTSMESLHLSAAMLSPVDIVASPTCLGQSTAMNVQSGLYFGQLGAVREIVKQLADEAFHGKPLILVGTGGFSHLFESENIFHTIVPDLVLEGLKVILEKNLL